jgi:hypothetical protein
MPTFYNDVDGKVEAVLENLLTTQAATTGSNIASVAIHTGLSTDDVTEDLIFGLVESAEESPSGTGNWICSTTVAVYTQAETNTLATHRARVAEVRDVMMNDGIKTDINSDSTETLTCIAVQNFAFSQRVEDGYFIGEISFDVVCYGSE